METQHLVRLHPVPHPSAQVHRAGFGLDHPYIEQCWAPLLGPTSTLLLRRLPVLWHEHEHVEIEIGELARSLGLGASTGRHGSLQHTLDRLVRFRFADSEEPLDLEGVHRGGASPDPTTRSAAAVVPEPPRAPPRRAPRPSRAASRHTEPPDRRCRPPRSPQPTQPSRPSRPEPAPMNLTVASTTPLIVACRAHARATAHVASTRPSTKHTLAGSPPGNLRCSRFAQESRS